MLYITQEQIILFNVSSVSNLFMHMFSTNTYIVLLYTCSHIVNTVCLIKKINFIYITTVVFSRHVC